MLNFLEKLRSKPEPTKKIIAFSGALSFSGLIFVVWLSVIWPNWNFSRSQTASVVSADPSPIETLTETFGTAAAALNDQVGEIKSAVSNLSSLSATSSADSDTTATTSSSLPHSSTTPSN